MPREIDHAELLDAAERERVEQRLLWLRDPSRSRSGIHEDGSAYTRLMSEQGSESLEQAIRQQRYSAAELQRLPEVLADLAREPARRTGRAWLGAWLHTPLAIGSTERIPALALTPLVERVLPGHTPSPPTEALRALGVSLDDHVFRILELRERAEHEAEQERSKLKRLLPAAKTESDAPAPREAPAADTALIQLVAAPAAKAANAAETFLDQTDDAMREHSRWLIKHSDLPSTESDLARILLGLRGLELDGLAPPDRRFYRLATGARKLGFERDMTSRMRGENAPALLVPQPVALALNVPGDVRVMQPDIEYGILSDLAIAQGMGEGLALALVSPALGPILTRPSSVRPAELGQASVDAAFGGLFVQLRADATYLRRVDGFERDHAEKAARHAAVWLLLRARLHALMADTFSRATRSNAERAQQLTAAAERLFGFPVVRGARGVEGLLALTLLSFDDAERGFAGLHWGFGLHAALRNRYDEDYYLNPRVSEVLRGAAARGTEIDAAGVAEELGMRAALGGKRPAALARLFELLA